MDIKVEFNIFDTRMTKERTYYIRNYVIERSLGLSLPHTIQTLLDVMYEYRDAIAEKVDDIVCVIYNKFNAEYRNIEDLSDLIDWSVEVIKKNLPSKHNDELIKYMTVLIVRGVVDVSDKPLNVAVKYIVDVMKSQQFFSKLHITPIKGFNWGMLTTDGVPLKCDIPKDSKVYDIVFDALMYSGNLIDNEDDDVTTVTVNKDITMSEFISFIAKHVAIDVKFDFEKIYRNISGVEECHTFLCTTISEVYSFDDIDILDILNKPILTVD